VEEEATITRQGDIRDSLLVLVEVYLEDLVQDARRHSSH
jgi:hypothetical protein